MKKEDKWLEAANQGCKGITTESVKREKELKIESEIAVNVARLIYEKAEAEARIIKDYRSCEMHGPVVYLKDLKEICLSQEPEAPVQDNRLEALSLAEQTGFDAGVEYQKSKQEVSASQLAAAFHAGQNSVGYRDECMSRIDMTFENYLLKSQATRGEKE